MSYQIIYSRETEQRAADYASALVAGARTPGRYLSEALATVTGLTGERLMQALLNSKRPQIFAESAVVGDGSDWNNSELSILGDISIATDVTIFDDGKHRGPMQHGDPFQGTLVFTCGALLRNDHNLSTPDLLEVAPASSLDADAFYGLYQRRLIPVFRYIQKVAQDRRRPAVITIPGLGCGQFAGRFRGQVGSHLGEAIGRILHSERHCLTHIRLVLFDPFDECEDRTERFGGLTYRIRPLTRSSNPRPQLCPPAMYSEGDDHLDRCDLYSLVAWDQVSWPGNDFYIGSRATDDGVKAAATTSMTAMTGIEGRYEPARAMYLPPDGYSNWLDVVRRNELALTLGEPFMCSCRATA